MRPFQIIARIIIATSVVNCAPVRPDIPVAGRSGGPPTDTELHELTPIIPVILVRPATPEPPPAPRPPPSPGLLNPDGSINPPAPATIEMTKTKAGLIVLGVIVVATAIATGVIVTKKNQHSASSTPSNSTSSPSNSTFSCSIRSLGNDAISCRLAKLAEEELRWTSDFEFDFAQP